MIEGLILFANGILSINAGAFVIALLNGLNNNIDRSSIVINESQKSE